MPKIPEPLTRVLDRRYRVEGEIGRGGMATVYLAEDLRHRRPPWANSIFGEVCRTSWTSEPTTCSS